MQDVRSPGLTDTPGGGGRALGWLAVAAILSAQLIMVGAGLLRRSAIRAALAVSLAWLLVWPHQYAWYSVMIICVLAFYPASRLDWVALAWLSAITIAEMPGLGSAGDKTVGRVLAGILRDLGHVAQLVMLAALIAFVVLCLTRRWNATSEADVVPAAGQISMVPVGGSGS